MHLINVNDGNLVVFGVVYFFVCYSLYKWRIIRLWQQDLFTILKEKTDEEIEKKSNSFYEFLFIILRSFCLSWVLFMKLTSIFMIVCVVAGRFFSFKLFCKRYNRIVCCVPVIATQTIWTYFTTIFEKKWYWKISIRK